MCSRCPYWLEQWAEVLSEPGLTGGGSQDWGTSSRLLTGQAAYLLAKPRAWWTNRVYMLCTSSGVDTRSQCPTTGHCSECLHEYILYLSRYLDVCRRTVEHLLFALRRVMLVGKIICEACVQSYKKYTVPQHDASSSAQTTFNPPFQRKRAYSY